MEPNELQHFVIERNSFYVLSKNAAKQVEEMDVIIFNEMEAQGITEINDPVHGFKIEPNYNRQKYTTMERLIKRIKK